MSKPKKKYLDKLWMKAVKAMAGMRSEISGGVDRLSGHHLLRKPNDWLRYSLRNGICLTMGEHADLHWRGETDVRRWVAVSRGETFLDDLFDELRRKPGKPDPWEVEEILKEAIETGKMPERAW